MGLAADSPTLRDDSLFLVASITKPIVAAGVMLLVEQGQVSLDTRVEKLIPEFARNGVHQTTLRHLLTHTSGLPDQLPENAELRASRAPLSRFVAGACRVDLSFAPGKGVQYQSTGYALLGEVIERVSGRSCAAFLRDEVFAPLQMRDTELGAPQSWFAGTPPVIDRVPEIHVPPDQYLSTWGWNSEYWRRLGAPWGGVLSTTADIARFAWCWLNAGRGPRGSVWSPATIAASSRNQLHAFAELPEAERRTRGWGFGWRLSWPGHSACLGDLLSPEAYGHWGATGTVLWIDPTLDLFAVVLTTEPAACHNGVLTRLSNLIAAAVE
jgi:CubicO group peptidase (beta-lactamase class C family)